jgi:hypothetical protein
MKKTRRINKRRSKSRVKKGGAKKNNQNMSTITTQMIGGQVAPAPAPRPAPAPAPRPAPAQAQPPASVNINLDYNSVLRSLQTFGETVWRLKDATALGVEAANERVLAAQADKTALQSLDTATNALNNAFFGTGTGTSRSPGLFNIIIPSATFVPPSSAGPSPAPR